MARKKTKPAETSTPVEAIKHNQKARTNIPTRELSSFAEDDELRPKSVLYPRDPSLDPQLVWKGKDLLDAQPLEVPAVPIYIQEKIHPQAIIILLATNDFLLWYAKQKGNVKYRTIYQERKGFEWVNYNYLLRGTGETRRITSEEKSGDVKIPEGSQVYRRSPLTSPDVNTTTSKPFSFNGKIYSPGNGHWKTSIAGLNCLGIADRLEAYGATLGFRRFVNDFPFFPISETWTDTATGGYAEPKIYVVQTNAKAIERCLLMITDRGDLVVDPTCGSGTTAYVAEQWGRRWITIDTSRVSLALARTRLMAAKFPYYLLADSPAGRKKEAELTGVPIAADAPACTNDIQRGFIYKRVPHVTLKSIANNPDIKPGMTRTQIDAAIRKHADTETLVDQPYEDKGIVRVCGPFTVESLSPHRMLPQPNETAKPKAEAAATGATDFTTMILDNLRKAGVQNTVRSERLHFDRLDIFPGLHIHAEGEYTEKDKTKRVKVCIGPEFGTVDPVLLREAAKEAMQGVGCDLLLVCGFAFDPHVSQEAKKFGKLTVLCPRMNPDLALGDELLKKTASGNLFTVFGEPDLKLERSRDGKLIVEILGIDVYDPTTGAIRSHSSADIACWFIDPDYNEESFFVRHAYFCGGDEPCEKLKRALRAEIDEAEWSKLYATKSTPFDTPTRGKIAVKVINHYGDEVLKVYPVATVTPLGSAKKGRS